MPLSKEQKVYIIENYKVFGSYTVFRRKFCSHFECREAPSHTNVKNLINKFRNTGSVQNILQSGSPKSVCTNDKIEEVRVLLERCPTLSIRRLNATSGVSVGTAHTIARSILNLYPYKIKILHQLKPPDYAKRVRFAKWFIDQENIQNIFYASDEAYFYLNGAVNNHNFRIWSDKDPKLILETPLNPEKILIWCAVCSTRIIGPFFFENTVNNENYLSMLKLFFWPRVYRQKTGKDFYFQQDGAPAHRHKLVQEWLNEKFGDHFVNKDLWPPRSPDLNPCDFFLWGYIKHQVYAQMPKSIAELKALIEEEIKNINSTTLQAVFENLRKRCLLVIENEGKHIE